MLDISDYKDTAAEFQLAVMSLRQASLHPQIAITEIASPDKLARHSLALSAEIATSAHDHDAELGSGRFVLLNSDTPQQGWGGNFRVICFARSPLESDIAREGRISEVAWSWLTDALRNRSAEYLNEAGTITRIISQGFGSIADQSDHGQLELRASWSPLSNNFANHLEAWVDLMAMMAGLPPANDISPLNLD